MSEHTKGPWYLWPLEGADHTVIATRPYDGAENGFDHEVLGTSEWIRVKPEDARLIAAAPDLLAACEAAKRELERLSMVVCEEDAESISETLYAIANAMLRARGGDR